MGRRRQLGVITIGQAPRDDVVPGMKAVLGENVDVEEAGALDGLDRRAIEAFAPRAGDHPLASRLTDGSEVVVAKELLLSRLQACIDRLAPRCQALLVFCTGGFPGLAAPVPLLDADRLLKGVVSGLLPRNAVLGVVTPLEWQTATVADKWGEHARKVVGATTSPYQGEEGLRAAARSLRERGAVLIVMDCMGFAERHRAVVRADAGLPVVLASTAVARVAAEVV